MQSQKFETRKKVKIKNHKMIQDLRIKEKGIFEKIVRREDGRLFRIQFVVFERDGAIRGKIISCEEVFSLPIWEKESLVPFVEVKGDTETSSPYFNIFDFLKAQPIRGPSLNL